MAVAVAPRDLAGGQGVDDSGPLGDALLRDRIEYSERWVSALSGRVLS